MQQRIISRGVAALLTASLLAGTGPAAAALALSSSSFADGGMLAKKNAADDPMRMCGGENVSPPLAWSGASEKTKSFVLFMFDPDGGGGHGVSHWLAYNIPANVTSLAEGEATKGSAHFTGGKGTRNNALYIGPCPPVGDVPHHYVFTIVATDLDIGALKPGMNRDEVYAAIEGHTLGGASTVGKFAR